MTNDLPLSTEDEQAPSAAAEAAESTWLLAVPDDPADVQEVTFVPATATPSERATTWLTVDAADVVDVTDHR